MTDSGTVDLAAAIVDTDPDRDHLWAIGVSGTALALTTAEIGTETIAETGGEAMRVRGIKWTLAIKKETEKQREKKKERRRGMGAGATMAARSTQYQEVRYDIYSLI